jgi:RNA polymerase sigma-70 factor, ECF subfamily
MSSPSTLDPFEQDRPRLVGLAYRMTGTLADAEDVVQDAWIRWQSVDPATVSNPAAWLTTVTARLALDRLRTMRRRRETYVGPWLPEPLVTEEGPAEAAELAESLRLGFLTLLDELKPIDRVIFLLADVFTVPFADIAVAVGKSEAACRQIASRARRRVRRPGPERDLARDREIVDALMGTVAAGDVEATLRLLAPDVVLVSDGGAERQAARHPLRGSDRVARFLINLGRRFAGEIAVHPAVVNGDAGVVVMLSGDVDFIIACDIEEGRVTSIWGVRNPDKLRRVGHPVTIE